MKAKMLKIAGVKTEKQFYAKYPTQEAFMKVHGKEFKKAQIGTYIGGTANAMPEMLNFQDAYNQADYNATGSTQETRDQKAQQQAELAANQKTANSKDGGFDINQLAEIAQSFEDGGYIPIAQTGIIQGPANAPSNNYFQNNNPFFTTNPGPTGLNNPAVAASPQSQSNIGNQIATAIPVVGDIIGGFQALKAEKKALKAARQMQGVTDVQLKASATRPEKTERRYVRPEDALISGNQMNPSGGVGTNVLAQEGITVSGKPISKKDIRKEKDVLKVLPNSSLYPEDEANYIRTTKSLKGLGKRNKQVEQQATNEFVDWYQHPETLKRFTENTGMDSARLQDFIGKGLRTPMRPAKDDDYLEYNENAQWRSPFWQDQNYRTLNKNTGEILYQPNLERTFGSEKAKNILQHELGHASNLDEVLGPKLMSILGKPTNVFREEKAYIGRPTEAYGNFHEFRKNLGLKPGQKIDEATLKKLTKKKGLDQERFYRAYSPDKIAKAINTIAYNNEDVDNLMYAEDGGEIQNTYAPGTLYDDLGYEPLEDSDQVKQFAKGGYLPKGQNGLNNYFNTLGGGGSGFSGAGSGGTTPWGMIGNAGQSLAGAVTGGQNGGGQVGGAVGGAIGSAFGPAGKAIGQTVGALAGNLLDTNTKKIKKAQATTSRNISGISANSMGQAIQGQNASVMEDGGWVSNDWTPQLITKFGDHSPEDVYDFAHEGMQSLRAGGHLKEYKEPSERALQTYAMGGELQTHWGGDIEEMSQNPYLPGDGITYMPHGQSHEESDGYGRTGIGITYGDNPVEVERREPITKLKDGSSGEDNLVVYGNLQIPKYGVDLLGDKKAKGMKFKHYVNDLSKGENKQNKIIESSVSDLDSLQVRNSFDKLKLSALEANVKGANMKLKDIADKKIKAADLQNAINDTAEEYGLVADALAKGKAIKDKEAMKQQAKNGKLLKAQVGTGISNNSPIELNDVIIPAKMKSFNFRKEGLPKLTPASINSPNQQRPGAEDFYDQYVQPYVASDVISAIDNSDIEEEAKKVKPWQTMLYNEILQRTRPSDAEPLDPRQLMGEMYAMSNNQLEPVQAQLYHPQLADANSRISLQDQINEITAQTRAAQKMVGYNPAAQAAIAAQAYEAINKVKGEEFRLNQDRTDKRIAENIATLNDAQLKNLGILDTQYGRQAEAKSNTKATTLAALNSISDKYAKNQLENRQLKAYENLYNYRYDDNGRLVNMNPLAQFNTSGLLTSSDKKKSQSGEDLLPVYDKEGNVISYKVKQESKSKTSKNGSIVRSLKNI